MKNIIIFLLILSTTAVYSANTPHNNSGYNNNASHVTCSSKKGHRKTCNANTSGGVQLSRQLSRATCNGNWGYTQNQIWVDNGCRAKFQLFVNGGQRHGNTRNNNAGHSNTNNTNSAGHGNTNNTNSAGHGNTSNTNSAGHGNNNYNNNNNAGHGNQGYNNRVVCESINYNRSNCAIPQGANVSLSRQLSSSSCEHNWGFGGGYVWVSNGCRAEFSINSNAH